MKILVHYDLRYTACPTPTGVGKHIVQMVNGLARTPGIEVTVLATRDQLEADGKMPAANALHALPALSVPLSNKMSRLLWTVLDRPAADRWCAGFDWVYSPQECYAPVRQTRFAATLHGEPYFERHLPSWGRMSARLARFRSGLVHRKFARRARLILSVSEYLKTHIVERFGADPTRVAVIGNGVEEIFFQAASLPRGTSGSNADRPFVLCVGGLNELDGAQYLLPAARVLAQRAPELQILLAGRLHEPQYLAQARELKNVVLLGYVPAEKLAPMMRDAVALLFLSAVESFGITLVEAMAVGTPIIASRLTAIPETVGDAGIFVDVARPEEAADAVLELWKNQGSAQPYIERGRQRATRFTWPACVGRLVEALRSAS